MGDIISGRIASSNNITSNSDNILSSDIGVVLGVVLDENSVEIKNKLNKISYIGAIRYKKLDDFTTKLEESPLALKANQNTSTLPVENELVRIITTGGGVFYERFGNGDNPNNNAIINQISFNLHKLKLFEGVTSTPNALLN